MCLPVVCLSVLQWRQRLTNIGGRLKPAPSEAREARSAGMASGLGLGRGTVPSPQHGGQAMPPGKCLNFNMQICAF